MPRTPQRLPFPLSERVAATSNRITQRYGRAIDYALAGIPFLSAATVELPYREQTAEMRREQVDNEPEPGEQSLSGWWLRSQASWHQGAGTRFQEPRGEQVASNRFFDSAGIDVWTEGELKLQKRLVQSIASGVEFTNIIEIAGTIYGTTLTQIKKTVVGSTSVSTLETQPGETWKDLQVGASQWYAVTQSGKVYIGPVTGASTKNLPLTNADTVTAAPRLLWAKHRLWATYGRRVYVVDSTAATGTAQAPKYSHPTTDWTYTAIAEGPSCIYLAGTSEAESSIQKITLKDDGDLPALTAGITTAILPPGERVERLAVLAGSWLAIATNRGMRIGAIGENGDITYGPLFVRPEGASSAKALTSWDRFFYCAWQTADNKAVVWRVDISQQVEDGVAAFARDVESPTAGAFTSLAITGEGRIVAAHSAGAYWYQHPTELVPSGWIEFGKIRFRTSEPKVYKYVQLETDPLRGMLQVDAITESGSTAAVMTYTVQGSPTAGDAEVPTLLGPMRSMGLRLAFARSASTTTGPLVRSYTVKALPATKPQVMMQIPLRCYDFEMWGTGQRDGHDGWARARLGALRQLESVGDLVVLQDFSAEDPIGRLVRIESIEFTQTAPPPATRDARAFGGVLLLTVRTMD